MPKDTLAIELDAATLHQERFEPLPSHVFSTLSIARCEAERIEDVIPLEALVGLLCDHSDYMADLERSLSQQSALSLGGNHLSIYHTGVLCHDKVSDI
jgi:hypothetical protein